ncbi:MFS transporter [Ornithinimicrobium murale]|uniref:MFS transporter n=1 Tax=Ornithinimicrobium murale TaxID=1050153 RepID=UPI000E0D302A|nr:MFS transporter [Ornithinimicrobium murale]
MLIVGMFAQASTSTFFVGLAAIGPALRHAEGLSLGELGILLGAPMAGFVMTLLLWGAATDRFDERPVMAVGLAATAYFLVLTSSVSGLWPLSLCLALAGAAAASVNAASGRAVLRWFPRERRGFAMGLRQTSVPLGAAAAALMLPTMVAGWGIGFAFRSLAAVAMMAAVSSWIWIREPPQDHEFGTAGTIEARVKEPDNERRNRQRALRNVIVAGVALVMCQATFVSFVVEMLHGHRGLTLRSASLVFAVAQLTGAGARVLVGSWSDNVPDRLMPLRVVAFGMAAGGASLGLAVDGPLPLLVVLSVIVGAFVICWNGLAFTVAGELAPPGRMGTTLGLQSTANFLVAGVTPYCVGTFIAFAGFSAGFGFIAVPAAAAGLLLVRIHRRARDGVTVHEQEMSS